MAAITCPRCCGAGWKPGERECYRCDGLGLIERVERVERVEQSELEWPFNSVRGDTPLGYHWSSGRLL